ncbi:MAG: penicillin acylase family protein [bacterium]
MTKGARYLLKLSILLLVVFFTIVLFSYFLLTKSLPETRGRVTLSILESEVQVYRDDFGVPHIFAENERDLYKAAGFVTAQDRLWQMDFHRRAATGRLAEIFGESALESDIYVRTLGLNRIAAKVVENLSVESRMILEAYAEGVNAFIDSHIDRLPIEFAILKYQPEKWQVTDSVAFSRLMAWKLSFSWYIEIVLYRLVNELGLEKVREIFPDFPAQGPFIVASEQKKTSLEMQHFLQKGLSLRKILGISGAHLGSNSWVVSGNLTDCGKPILANDPHLELRMPSIWYEMHLVCDDLNVAGVTLPGTPGVLIGHNLEAAWGLTNGMIDDVDFYFEKVNPDSASQYWTGKDWVEFESVEERIAVRDGNPLNLPVRISRNGPIITSLHPGLKNSGAAVAMRWTGAQASDEFLALNKLQKARTWQDFTEAVKHFRVPAQNFIFANADGDIGYYLAGAVPIRNNTTGFLPHKGWLLKGQWLQEIPFEKLPHALNPPSNFIVTANNKIVDGRYPYYLSNLWEPPSRAKRIHELLAQKDKISVNDIKEMQTDVRSDFALQILPFLMESVEAELAASHQEKLLVAYNLLKEWDGQETPESLAPAFFHAFVIKLFDNTFRDEMGEELYQNYIRLANVPVRVILALLQKKTTTWFDNVNTPEKESAQNILVQSLMEASTLLTELAGEEISGWTWGRVHKLLMKHPLGATKPLDVILNLGPYPRGGSATTINNSEYSLLEPFDAVLGASTRQIVDLCDTEHTLSVITAGQSGQRMSEHYKDQTQLWLNGNYHPMVINEEEIIQNADERLILKPN